jgi:hypothetical protein
VAAAAERLLGEAEAVKAVTQVGLDDLGQAWQRAVSTIAVAAVDKLSSVWRPNLHLALLSTYRPPCCPPPIQVLEALPELGPYEVRLSHRALLEACRASLALPKEKAGHALQLLATAAAASPAQPEVRAKSWPAIRAGLEGLGIGAEVRVWRCGVAVRVQACSVLLLCRRWRLWWGGAALASQASYG